MWSFFIPRLLDLWDELRQLRLRFRSRTRSRSPAIKLNCSLNFRSDKIGVLAIRSNANSCYSQTHRSQARTSDGRPPLGGLTAWVPGRARPMVVPICSEVACTQCAEDCSRYIHGIGRLCPIVNSFKGLAETNPSLNCSSGNNFPEVPGTLQPSFAVLQGLSLLGFLVFVLAVP